MQRLPIQTGDWDALIRFLGVAHRANGYLEGSADGSIVDLAGAGAVGDNSTDDTAAITRALAEAAANGGGVVRGNPGKTYLTTGAHTIAKNVWVTDATFNHTGNNSCFTYDGQDAGVGWSDDDNPRTGIERVRILGNSGGSAAGLEIRNTQHYTVRDTVIGGAANGKGYTAGVGILVSSTAYWNENLQLENVFVGGCATGIGLTGTSVSNNSMEYHRYRGVSISVPASGVGLDVGMSGGAHLTLSNGNLDVNFWLNGDNAIGVNVRANQSIDDSTWAHFHGEVLNSHTGCVSVKNRGTYTPRGPGGNTFPFGTTLATADVTGATSTDLTGGLKSRTDFLPGAQGMVYEAFPIWAAGSILTMVSGHMYCELVALKAWDVASKVIVFLNGTSAASGLTLLKVGLYTTAGTLVASSVDSKANFLGAGAYVVTSFTTPYIVPSNTGGGYYAAILATGTTPPKLNSAASFGAGAVGVSPSGSGSALCVQMTGQTDLPAPATFGGDAQPFYIAVA